MSTRKDTYSGFSRCKLHHSTPFLLSRYENIQHISVLLKRKEGEGERERVRRGVHGRTGRVRDEERCLDDRFTGSNSWPSTCLPSLQLLSVLHRLSDVIQASRGLDLNTCVHPPNDKVQVTQATVKSI